VRNVAKFRENSRKLARFKVHEIREILRN
jgi:hypothetical protein